MMNTPTSEEMKARRKFAKEMHGRWIGPFPISDFLDLLPCPETRLTSPRDVFSGLPGNQFDADTHHPLINALESLNLENLQFVDSCHNTVDKGPDYKLTRPDIYACSSNFESESQGLHPSPTQISELLLFKLKRGKHDPFSDKPDESSDATFENAHIGTQGKIAAMLNEALSRSFRTHAFLIFMDDHIARLFRADRAGVLVSEAYDYRAQEAHLVEFLCRFNLTTAEERGIDTTTATDYCGRIPVLSANIGGELGKDIIGEVEGDLPHIGSLVGRARRAVKVHNQTTGQRYFMKDGWRADLPEMTEEWRIVTELHENQVPHIPRILFGGDVAGGKYHRTLADKYADKSWRVGPKNKLTPRVHYRFIEEDIGRPLEEFKDAKQLTRVLADIIEALQAAWVRCRYLHRDVSSTNIMITPAGRGVLIDWEFATKAPPEGLQEYASAPDRIGTWNYMSSGLLRQPEKRRTPLDDVQSVYWVAYENGLNYLRHNYPDLLLAVSCLKEYDPLTKTGGFIKYSLLACDPPIEFTNNPAFSWFFDRFHDMICSADLWEGRLSRDMDPTWVGLQPPNLPDHDQILQVFQAALDLPDDQWSPERTQTRQLSEAVKRIATD